MSDILIELDEIKERLDKLEAAMKELEDYTKKIGRFCSMQSSINNVLKYLVRKKYTEKELEIALKEYEDAQKRLHSEEEKEEKKEEN